jgi:flagellar biogenesis protein FliO
MLSFDKPYLGKISKKDDKELKILILPDLQIEKNSSKTLNSPIAQKIEIIKQDKQIYIKISATDTFTVKASKTIDNYGLRIRIKPFILKPIQEKSYETKIDSDMTSSFLKVIAVLGFLLLVLYLLKKWIQNKDSNGWLFNKNGSDKKEIKVTNQKVLDTKNRVAVIEYNNHEYLVILGSNNIILDKFIKDNSSKFDQLLDENSDQLNSMLDTN